MAQKTAKRRRKSAILSAIGQPQSLVWHIPLYKKAQKKCPKNIGHYNFQDLFLFLWQCHIAPLEKGE